MCMELDRRVLWWERRLLKPDLTVTRVTADVKIPADPTTNTTDCHLPNGGSDPVRYCVSIATCPSGYVLLGCSGWHNFLCQADKCELIGSIPSGGSCETMIFIPAPLSNSQDLYSYAICGKVD